MKERGRVVRVVAFQRKKRVWHSRERSRSVKLKVKVNDSHPAKAPASQVTNSRPFSSTLISVGLFCTSADSSRPVQFQHRLICRSIQELAFRLMLNRSDHHDNLPFLEVDFSGVAVVLFHSYWNIKQILI